MNNSMRLFLFLSVGWLVLSTGRLGHAEDWKGESEESVLSLGGMAGLGIIDSVSGVAILGTLSKKIVNHGFVPDISNSVSLEGAIGPVILGVGSALVYSVHARWDFEKDKNWTLYALGGFGGNTYNLAGINKSEFFPRFGVGTFYKMSGPLNARFEISHEVVAIGINIPFY